MANIFDVYTIKRSLETDMTAGTESMANIMSELSMSTRTAKSGVTMSFAFSFTKNFSS
ncbi:hypothetical protein SDC9_207501 [bioreactor metagenome]|uniref:Uncharacterized protein n=1 Tax=bioreactor metagenome TaxID=1076179 RepID=A0A645JAM1_9ZZZZ